MKAKVERLRVGLVAGTVVLLLVLVGAFSYSRYRAGKSWLDRAKKRSGASLVRETDGFTYSQSLKGRTVFTLHAAKAFQHTDGLWKLHDVVLTLYGLRDDRADRVYGDDFEWDEAKGIARAVGEVQMDLQVPAGMAMAERGGGPSANARNSGDAESIHVRTSGLVFLRKLGVAATQEQIEFRYGGLTCVARGAEFDNNPSSLHLLAKVQVNGEMQGSPMAMTATRADFDRGTNVVSLAQPVVTSDKRKGRAMNAVLHLRRDGSVETAEALGGVTLDDGVRHVSAPRLDAVMNEKNRPQSAVFSGGVRMVDDSSQRPLRGEAGDVRLRFDAQGHPVQVTALHHAFLSAPEADGKGPALQRDLRGEQIVGNLVADEQGHARLRQVRAVGGAGSAATMRGESVVAGVAGGVRSTSVAADDLLLKFAAGQTAQVRLDSLHGQGHTVLRQTAPAGEERVSEGDALDVVFGAAAATKQIAKMEIVSAVQQGHVSVSDRRAGKVSSDAKTASSDAKPPTITTGKADKAAYEGRRERLTLSGGAHIADGSTSLSADTVVLDQGSGDAEAQGGVVASVSGSVGSPAQATHVVAAHATLHHATQVAEFQAMPGATVRMWQDASQIEAASIVIDRQKNTLTARPAVAGGVVHAVFAQGQTSAGMKPAGTDRAGTARTSTAPGIVRVESRQMVYSEAERQATFSGPVKIDGMAGEVRAQRATVFFAPVGEGGGKRTASGAGLPMGSLDHMVVAGDVKIDQPGRKATGEQLVYTGSDGSFVMTGTASAPPRVEDSQQGNVTGASLLFRAGDSTIVVAGAPAGPQHERARTELHVRQ